MTYEELKLGDTYEKVVKITSNMVEKFAEITGDKNPVHLDEEFAKKTIFGSRIAHGILIVGQISSILGMEFPGPGTIYMKSDTKFLRPVYINEEIKIIISIKEKIDVKKRLVLATTVIKADGKNAIEGDALVLFNK